MPLSVGERVVTSAEEFGATHINNTQGREVGRNLGNVAVDIATSALDSLPLPPYARRAATITAMATAALGPPAIILTGVAAVFGLVVDAATGNLDGRLRCRCWER